MPSPITRSQLEAVVGPLLAEHPEALRSLALEGAERLCRLLPGADLLVYDVYAVAMGWTFTGKAGDLVVHLPVYRKHINLGFNFGTELDDPEGRLQGKGKSTRHLRLGSREQLDDAYVVGLIQASVALARRGGSAGRVVLKSSPGSSATRR